MKFSIGDIVLLKHTGAEGVVTGYISPDLLEISVEGTHFPVYADDLDHPYLKWFTEQKSIKKSNLYPPDPAHPIPSPAISPQVPTGFHLSFFPIYRFDELEDIAEKFKIYFINQTAHTLWLQYECASPFGCLFAHQTRIPPFAHFYLHDIWFDEMQDQPRFSWILTRESDKDKTSFKDTLRITRKKLFAYITRIQQQNDPMFHIQLARDFPAQTFQPDEQQLPRSFEKAEKLRADHQAKRIKPVHEIDLHIERLVEQTQGLSNFDMLQLQLDAFALALDTAVAAGQQSMVVIHGVGKGRLKDEIHKILSTSYQVAYFQNEWSPRYGYGATTIFFRT